MMPPMDNLPEILLALMLRHAPPGHTAFSLAPAADCPPHAAACPGAAWGELHGWARRETDEQGTARYRVIAQALADEARALLCTDAAGTRVAGCVQVPGAVGPKRQQRWTPMRLAVAGLAVAQMESGFREDVHNGRGHAKRPSADGGRGRGPANEACLAQIHPAIAWRFADAAPELRAKAERGDSAAREEIARSLLGADYEATRRCWRAGLRMLVHAYAYCEWRRIREPSQVAPEKAWAMYSLYGTGTSCIAFNKGKTERRTNHFERLHGEARQLAARAQDEGRSVSGAGGGNVAVSSSSSSSPEGP